MNAATALRHARRRAGLSQRKLAGRAGVPQSTVARIESGTVDPAVSTLDRLLRACGEQLEAMPVIGAQVDRTLIADQLERSPRNRVEAVAEAAAAMDRLRDAFRRTAAPV